MNKTIASYNQTAKEYATKVAGLVPMNDLEKFISFLPPHKPCVLDVGCGSGVTAKVLNDKGCIVTGIDLSTELLKIAEQTSPHTDFYHMDMRELGFFQETFDGVLNVGALLHLPRKDVFGALEETYSILDKEGILYLSVKEGQGQGFEKDKRYGNVEKWWTYFQQNEINDLLDKVGFEVLESSTQSYEDKYRNAHPWMNFFARKN